MKQLFFVVLFIMSFVYCSNNKNAIEQYSALSAKFEKEEVKESNGDYYLTTPLNWEFIEHEPYLDIIYVHSYKGDDNNVIQIYKLTSDKDLKELNQSFVHSTETLLPTVNQKVTVVDYGETDILKYHSYFCHASYPKPANNETVSFMMKSKEEGVYYRLIAFGEKESMPMLLQCLKTFEILK